MRRRKKITFSIVAIALSVLPPLCACKGRMDAQPQTPVLTPTPTIDRTQLALDTQQNPYRQFAAGLLARTTYKTEGTGRVGVEVWDLLVGPSKKTDAVSLPGGAVFDVRSGNGVLTAGGKPREIQMGATFSLDDGEAFQIENRSADDAISIRVVLVRGSQK